MGKKSGKAAYPVQQSAYPTQPAPSYPPQQAMQYGAPPPYAPPGAYPPPQQQYYQPQPLPGSDMGMGMPGYQPQPGMQPMMGQAAPAYSNYNYSPNGQPVVVNNAFDAGARFDKNSAPSIPPPPPGCYANAAQQASAQGHSVVMQQTRSDFLTGGSGGGYTFI
ncbi:DAZ-associated protein 2-like [Symsagittifera roscoffensis]|uniref:DAZ-associated protein 2-like n=1 Tax=Symsagittifera roscoffensis TaxID=84072 RepID=UPI00307BD4AA